MPEYSKRLRVYRRLKQYCCASHKGVGLPMRLYKSICGTLAIIRTVSSEDIDKHVALRVEMRDACRCFYSVGLLEIGVPFIVGL